MVDITARAIADSVNPQGIRLITMLSRYPKFIHAEHLRHRAFSFCVSSSRAIPAAKNIEEVGSDKLRASPIWWAKEQRGMQGEEYLDPADTDQAMACWAEAAHFAVSSAEEMMTISTHKSIVNRILEPFLHVNVLVTGTTLGWMNFFGLRLDRAAQPEMRALAEETWKVWNESQPEKLEPGQWHLPFIGEEDRDSITTADPIIRWERALRVSVARCARLSYLSFSTGKRATIEEDLKLYDRLVGSSPIHASPAEHQATPDIWENKNFSYNDFTGQSYYQNHQNNWKYFEQSGNLGPGWRQYRKMLPNEAVAPLPKEYSSVP